MFKTATQIVRKSIFPLFYYGHSGKNFSFGVQGTGFFFDEEGHFLTAEHVVRKLPKGMRFGYAGNTPHANKKAAGFVPVQIIATNKNLDLAIGKIESEMLPPLKFAKSKALVGESISLCGYPLPVIKPSSKTLKVNGKNVVNFNLNITSVRQYWQPTIKMDEIPKGILYNKTFHSFITQHSALPGMSGGPIFNIAGEVVGITSANYSRKVQRTPKLHTVVENGIGIDLHEILNFVSHH